VVLQVQIPLVLLHMILDGGYPFSCVTITTTFFGLTAAHRIR
jgi:hypothetical protein